MPTTLRYVGILLRPNDLAADAVQLFGGE